MVTSKPPRARTSAPASIAQRLKNPRCGKGFPPRRLFFAAFAAFFPKDLPAGSDSLSVRGKKLPLFNQTGNL